MANVTERLQDALTERYVIDGEVGRGGMATVYRARDVKHDRVVALKVFDPELAQVLGSERFLREIKLTAQLHHPHILPLYDSGAADGLLYYVMPFVEGESLRQRLTREKQLPLEDALRISREVADALGYAHSHDVIHRDIKPENILLESGHAVVADFGIARAITRAGGDKLTATGLALGTPAYMSPEQATGERELDGRSDVYSLACVLYEMLAGEPPITGPSVPVMLARKSVEAPPPLRLTRSAVPPQVEQAVTQALAVTPADRQRTAAEFAEQLAGGAALPRTGEFAVPVAPRRGRLVTTRAAIAALALAVVGVLAWWVARRDHAAIGAATRVVVLPYQNQTGDSTLNPIGQMVAEWITEGLAQTSEVQVVPHLIVLQTLAALKPAPGASGGVAPIQELAHETQAGLAVAGSYYRRGDSVEFHSEVVDVGTGRQLGPVEPVRGPARDPASVIDSVRLRVMGVLATRLGVLSWELPPAVRPPTYDAYRAYAQAMDRWIAGHYGEAGALFERAFALDSTYLRAKLIAAVAYGNGGDYAKRDSVLAFVLPRRSRLSAYDQYRLDWYLAGRRGDREAQLKAIRAAVRLAPVGTARFALMVTLEASGRPREALVSLEDLQREGMPQGALSWYAVWGLRTELYHLLGEHERELEVTRDGRAQLGGSLASLEYEGRALAALGHVDELRGLSDEIAARAAGQGRTAGDVLLTIARELRAHGHAPEAAELAQRDLQWCAGLAASGAGSVCAHRLKASLFAVRERWAEAATQWDSVAADSEDAVDRLGMRGVLAARLGQADSARGIAGELARLNEPGLTGEHTLWRARIAALLGQKDSAVTLLRQAFGEGVPYGLWLHTDMDLESLRDYKPYQELVRPKG